MPPKPKKEAPKKKAAPAKFNPPQPVKEVIIPTPDKPPKKAVATKRSVDAASTKIAPKVSKATMTTPKTSEYKPLSERAGMKASPFMQASRKSPEKVEPKRTSKVSPEIKPPPIDKRLSQKPKESAKKPSAKLTQGPSKVPQKASPVMKASYKSPEKVEPKKNSRPEIKPPPIDKRLSHIAKETSKKPSPKLTQGPSKVLKKTASPTELQRVSKAVPETQSFGPSPSVVSSSPKSAAAEVKKIKTRHSLDLQKKIDMKKGLGKSQPAQEPPQEPLPPAPIPPAPKAAPPIMIVSAPGPPPPKAPESVSPSKLVWGPPSAPPTDADKPPKRRGPRHEEWERRQHARVANKQYLFLTGPNGRPYFRREAVQKVCGACVYEFLPARHDIIRCRVCTRIPFDDAPLLT